MGLQLLGNCPGFSGSIALLVLYLHSSLCPTFFHFLIFFQNRDGNPLSLDNPALLALSYSPQDLFKHFSLPFLIAPLPPYLLDLCTAVHTTGRNLSLKGSYEPITERKLFLIFCGGCHYQWP